MATWRDLWIPLWAAAALAAAGCASEGVAARDSSGEADDDYMGDDDYGAADDDASDDDSAPPPEEEDNDFLTARPVGADRFVFVVNTERDTVSKIDVDTLAVTTLPTGARPVQVAVTPGGEQAVTFNADSDDVSVIDVAAGAVTDVAVRDDLNTLAMSPSGGHVLCYYDTDNEDGASPPSGVQSFNDVSVVDLGTLETQSFAVGFNPTDVHFTPDGSLAVLSSDGALSLVDLSRPIAEVGGELVLISDDQLDPPEVEEVELTPDGRFVYGRRRAANEIFAVDLESLEVMALPAGDDPSDMDLSPDGASVVVVSRGTQELLVYDAHDPATEPLAVPVPPEVTAGSVYLSPTGGAAVVYTTAVREDRFGYWDLATGEIGVHPLVKPVEAARIAPDGASVIFFHTLEDVSGAPADAYTGRWAISLVRLQDFLVQPVIVEDPVDSYVDSDDGRHGVFLMTDNSLVGVIDYEHLLVDDVEVPSVPRHVGMLPDTGLAYVSQEHPLGRISFLDAAALSTSTVTGFELNSQIED